VAQGLAVVVPPSGFGYQLVRLDGVPVPNWGYVDASASMYGPRAAPGLAPSEPIGLRGFLRRAAHPDVAMPLGAAILVLVLLLAWLA
jgi:hypothetical protein